MKLHYYPETDSLYIELSARPSAETREIASGLNADFDITGNLVGLDIDGASGKLDLTTLEMVSLPFGTLKAALSGTVASNTVGIRWGYSGHPKSESNLLLRSNSAASFIGLA
jgi:uncharacterized protein YuzE